jgi:hypothetical protein
MAGEDQHNNTPVLQNDNNLPSTCSLNDKEIQFCQLYSRGRAPYAGNPIRCYQEVFGGDDMYSGSKAYILLSRADIQEYLEKSSMGCFDEAKYIKEFIKTNMMHIVEEMSQKTYKDRKGNDVPPTAARGVAVSAAKVLMDLYPIKENQGDVTINNKNGGNITFNVIAPGGSKKKEIEDGQ